MEKVFIVYELDVPYCEAFIRCFDSRMAAEQYINNQLIPTVEYDEPIDFAIHALPLSSLVTGIVNFPE